MARIPQNPQNLRPEDRNKETLCPVSRRDRRRTETRERLYDASIRLLSEHDFDTVTVEMITEAAEVGKGTFFNYFSNKEAVVGYYFETQLRILKETLQAAQSNPERSGERELTEDSETAASEGGPCWRRIISIVHESVERRGKEKHFTRTLLSLALTNPDVRAANIEFRRRIMEAICWLIEDGQAHNEIRADIPAEELAGYMYTAYLGALYMWSQSESDESLHYAIDQAYARVWSGIRRDSQAP
jgi:AcrR family transcriptional regulator